MLQKFMKSKQSISHGVVCKMMLLTLFNKAHVMYILLSMIGLFHRNTQIAVFFRKVCSEHESEYLPLVIYSCFKFHFF
jgi:hypothetical protein